MITTIIKSSNKEVSQRKLEIYDKYNKAVSENRKR